MDMKRPECWRPLIIDPWKMLEKSCLKPLDPWTEWLKCCDIALPYEDRRSMRGNVLESYYESQTLLCFFRTKEEQERHRRQGMDFYTDCSAEHPRTELSWMQNCGLNSTKSSPKDFKRKTQGCSKNGLWSN
mmetsp:Transcript_15716/g.36034  ORF Transcript_15716/g.36034 Transcript_15716/m.36034 type:complete len:131 (+) Transcript_15716:3-395(+)